MDNVLRVYYLNAKNVNTKITNQTINDIIAQFLFLIKLAKTKERVAIIKGIKLIGFILH